MSTPASHLPYERSDATQQMDSHIAEASRKNAEAVNVGQDRLAHAKNFANELSDSRLREMAKRYRTRWTPAARAEKAKIIQSIRPWTRATGPKSGPYAKGAGVQKRAFASVMRQQNWFLRSVSPHSGQREIAQSLGIVSTAALNLLLAMERAEIWAFSACNRRQQ